MVDLSLGFPGSENIDHDMDECLLLHTFNKFGPLRDLFEGFENVWNSDFSLNTNISTFERFVVDWVNSIQYSLAYFFQILISVPKLAIRKQRQ